MSWKNTESRTSKVKQAVWCGWFLNFFRSSCLCLQRRRRTERTLGMRSPSCSSVMWSVSSSASTNSERSCPTSSSTRLTPSASRTSRSGNTVILWAVSSQNSRRWYQYFFLNRLQYFARGLQVYIRQLRVALQGKTGDALKTDEVTMQPVAMIKFPAAQIRI